MQEIVNAISYKLMVLITQKREGLDHASGASEIFFHFTSSLTVENALLATMTNVLLIIDLVLIWPLNHVCFTE